MAKRMVRAMVALGLALTTAGITAMPVRPSFPAMRLGVDSGTYTLSELAGLTEGDIVLRGVHPSYFLFLPVPIEWKLSGANVHLVFDYSDVLRPNSTLTLEVNNTPVASRKLAGAEAGTTQVWDVALPAELLDAESAGLRLSGFLRVRDDVCPDLEDEALWVRVAASSSAIEFQFDQQRLEPELGRLPHPFVRTGTLIPSRPLVVSPPDASRVEFQAALSVAGMLGAQSTWRGLELDGPVDSTFGVAGLEDRDVIYVMSAERLLALSADKVDWPLTYEFGTFVDEAGKPVQTETGILMLAASPWNPARGLMAVTGTTDPGVLRAAQALRHPELHSLARGAYALIPTTPEVQGAAGSTEMATTLKGLGYADQTVYGIGKQTLSYAVNLPYSVAPGDLRLAVHFSHAPFVTHDQSYLVLRVNGTPQAGVAMEAGNEAATWWDLTVPASQLRPGRNQLDLMFDLHPKDETACDDFAYDRAWGTLYADTSLWANLSADSPRADLGDFPIPFDDQALLVLPDEPNGDVRAAAFRLAGQMGTLLGKSSDGLLTTFADLVTVEELQARHVILIGQPRDHRWMAQALEAAPVRLSQDGRLLHSDELVLSFADGETVGLLELVDSPWGAGRSVLVVSGSDNRAVGWASDLLIDPIAQARLGGNVAVVDGQGTLTSLDTRQPIPPGIRPTGQPRLSIVQIALIGLLVVLAVVLSGALLARRRKW